MDEIYQKLIKPFPNAAYSEDRSRWNPTTSKGIILTSIKAQYIKERLNEVFGIFNWQFKESFIEKETAILCHGELLIIQKELERVIYATGGSPKKKNIPDTYKGAATDALSKAACFIGIGNEVFKGNVNLSTLTDNKSDEKPTKPVYGICPLCDAHMFLSEKKPDKNQVIYCSNFRQKVNDESHPTFTYTDQIPIPPELVDNPKLSREWLAKQKEKDAVSDYPI